MNREEKLRVEQGERLKSARLEAGFRSAASAANEFNWPESTYRAHEGGTRTIGQDDAEKYATKFRSRGAVVTAQSILFDRDDTPEAGVHHSVAVMGYVGAGAEILPEFEQVPPEGLETIDLPFEVPDELIALRIRGDSMLPVYRDGDAILVWREQRRPTDSFVGEEAAVKTSAGRRFLKEIQQGARRASFDLHSHNAKLIKGVNIEWVGEIYIIVRASQIRKVAAAKRKSSSLKSVRRNQLTAGMSKLPGMDER